MNQRGDYDALEEAANHALSTVFRDQQQAMVVKWTLQIEAIDNDGTSALWTLNTPGMALWERQGFCKYGLNYYDFLQNEVNRGSDE